MDSSLNSHSPLDHGLWQPHYSAWLYMSVSKTVPHPCLACVSLLLKAKYQHVDRNNLLDPFPKRTDGCGTQNTIRAPNASSSLFSSRVAPTHTFPEQQQDPGTHWNKSFLFYFILINSTKTPSEKPAVPRAHRIGCSPEGGWLCSRESLPPAS